MLFVACLLFLVVFVVCCVLFGVCRCLFCVGVVVAYVFGVVGCFCRLLFVVCI